MRQRYPSPSRSDEPADVGTSTDRSATTATAPDDVRVSQPPRPDVTLALLRDDGLELAVCNADDRCDFELLNLSADPCSTWDEALRISPQSGENWRPVSDDNGVLVIELADVERLALAGDSTVMIRQVTSDGRSSVQSLFRVVGLA